MYGYGFLNSFKSVGGTSFDPDALAFITAASITDATQQSAVNQLVIDLKIANIWAKMYAVYPFVGGSATSHKWNLKDPRDLDAAYRIVFSGGITHNSNGVTYGGVNGLSDTKFFGITGSNYGFGFYSRTNTASLGTDAYVDAGIHVFSNFSGSTYHRGIGASPDNYVNGSSIGFFCQYGKSSSSTAFLNNTKKLTGGGGASSGSQLFFGGGSNASDRNHSFAFRSDSLSDSEHSALYNAVITFNTSLGR